MFSPHNVVLGEACGGVLHGAGYCLDLWAGKLPWAMTHSLVPTSRPAWQRLLWAGAGALALVLGLIGVFLPVLPTVPFVLLSAFCFSRGSKRCERWLLAHPRFGPLVRDWRIHRAVPLRVKQLATAMMSVSALLSWWLMPTRVGWIPGVCCAAVAIWLWRLPTRVT